MQSSKLTQRSLFWLQLASSCLFLGRGWQFLFHPEQLEFWLANGTWVNIIGIGLLAGAVSVWLPSLSRSRYNLYLLILAIPLLLMSLASWANKDFALAQLLEMTGQWAPPVILWLVIRSYPPELIKRSLQLSIAFIFIGHGLYALGVYPRPEHFYEMTQSVLGISYESAGIFLLIAGILDMVVGGGVFNRTTARYVLLYAAIWGLLTAMARPFAYVELSTFLGDLNEWTPAMVYRLPHSSLPLGLFYLYKNAKKR